MEKSTKKFLSFPNIKKKISDFIKNEDWNITTKAAVIVWATWLATLWVSEALWYCEKQWWHFSWNVNWHYNWTGTFWATLWNAPGAWHCSVHTNRRGRTHSSYNRYTWACTWWLSCTAISANASWHYNVVPTCTNWTAVTAHCSHDNSWSWSWSWSWDSWDSWDS